MLAVDAQVVEVDVAALVGSALSPPRSPAIVVEAGLVPCAESGISIVSRSAFAAVVVVGAHHQHAGELALGAGRRLQAHAGKAARSPRALLQLEHQLERALAPLILRLERMQCRRSPAGAPPPR